MVRAPPCHGGVRGFESLLGRLRWKSYEKGKKAQGIIAQLGEHLPYKQGVTGSSPVGPTAKRTWLCRSGGTGRRTGLKILRDLYSRTGSIPVCGIKREIENVEKSAFSIFFGAKVIQTDVSR